MVLVLCDVCLVSGSVGIMFASRVLVFFLSHCPDSAAWCVCGKVVVLVLGLCLL